MDALSNFHGPNLFLEKLSQVNGDHIIGENSKGKQQLSFVSTSKIRHTCLCYWSC